MKKTVVFLFIGLFFVSAFAGEKLLVVYIYTEDSPHYRKINEKVLKNKYLAKRINKNFEFYKFQLGTEKAEAFIQRYHLEKKEGVYFIDPSSGSLLYRLTELNQPCRCANLINYFSRKLYKKDIKPEQYLEMAEKIGAYRKKIEKSSF